ncbi:hypothetical protein [Polaribacter sp.]|jgi:hypothetical protein|uniref:hypothetical protein n=1 Tax=Polaribacter sp. TaxID=1920175 RepID=UPI002757AAEA|nr:hypothetical protein [Polaribacter sp.]MDP4704454.1 hypothetical protein [Polaribacter sp.]
MTHLEFFINRVNVNDVPKLNKEQFLYILNIISLEGEINALDKVENQLSISSLRQNKVKEFNKLTKRRKPEQIYKTLIF